MNASTRVGQGIFDTDRDAVEALHLPSTPFSFKSKTKYGYTLGGILVLSLAQEE
jgi:hypothetical protein